MTGLPPTPAEIAAFVADRRLTLTRSWSSACLPVRITASDGRSTGSMLSASPKPMAIEYDTHRNDAWRFRDYVIRAFNDDKPYDRFLMEQLAGDEISPPKDPMTMLSLPPASTGWARCSENAGNQKDRHAAATMC